MGYGLHAALLQKFAAASVQSLNLGTNMTFDSEMLASQYVMQRRHPVLFSKIVGLVQMKQASKQASFSFGFVTGVAGAVAHAAPVESNSSFRALAKVTMAMVFKATFPH